MSFIHQLHTKLVKAKQPNFNSVGHQQLSTTCIRLTSKNCSAILNHAHLGNKR